MPQAIRRSVQGERNIVSKHPKDDTDKFPGAVSKWVVVALPLSTLCIVKAAEHIIVTDNIVSSIYEGIAKDTGTALGHLGITEIEIARLADRRVETGKGQQLGR